MMPQIFFKIIQEVGKGGCGNKSGPELIIIKAE